jgi:hypothetical protein
MSRWENAPDQRTLIRMSRAMMDLWCTSYRRPPKAVTLDIDDTWAFRHVQVPRMKRRTADTVGTVASLRVRRQVEMAAKIEQGALAALPAPAFGGNETMGETGLAGGFVSSCGFADGHRPERRLAQVDSSR